MINIFLRLCKDETPLVRKVAAQSLAKMVRLVKSTDTMNDLVSVFKAFSKDEQVVRSAYSEYIT